MRMLRSLLVPALALGFAIPWVVAGPSIRRNFDLAPVVEGEITTMATFATVSTLLGLQAPNTLDARPVLEILEER